MDVDGRWVTSDLASRITWQFDDLKLEDNKTNLRRWQVQRETELLFSEIRDRAEWGTLHFAGPAVSIILYWLVPGGTSG